MLTQKPHIRKFKVRKVPTPPEFLEFRSNEESPTSIKTSNSNKIADHINKTPRSPSPGTRKVIKLRSRVPIVARTLSDWKSLGMEITNRTISVSPKGTGGINSINSTNCSYGERPWTSNIKKGGTGNNIGNTNTSTSFRIRPSTPKVNLLQKKKRGFKQPIKYTIDDDSTRKENTTPNQGNNWKNKSAIFHNFNEKILEMMENQDEQMDELELNQQFLSDFLGLQPDKFEQLTKIEFKIDATIHNLQRIGEILPNLTELKLSDSIVKSMRDLGTSFKNVKILWIARVSLTDLCGISGFENLEEFYGSFNNIEDLFDLTYLEKLQVIDLEGNNICSLENLRYMKSSDNLYSINLSNNPISKKSTYKSYAIETLPRIQLLDDEPTKEWNKDNVEYSLESEKSKKLESMNMNILKNLKTSCEFLDSEMIMRLKKLGVSEVQIQENIDQAIEMMQGEPKEEELVYDIIKYNKSSTQGKGKTFLSQKLYISRPQTSSNLLSKGESGFSSLCTGQEVFAGNPLKAAKHKKEQGRGKEDIHSLLQDYMPAQQFKQIIMDNTSEEKISTREERNTGKMGFRINEPIRVKKIKHFNI